MDLTDLHLHWRVSQYKGKKYRSYSLARAFRKDGKNRKEICVKLGKLSTEAANRWRSLLKAIKKPNSFVTTLDDIAVVNHYAYLDVAAVSAIWDYWKLNDVFQCTKKREVHLSDIARMLTVNRCIDPSSKSQIPDWFKSTSLQWLLDVNTDSINPSRVFRELEAIEKNKETICSHLFKLISKHNPDSMKSVFYDLSSTTFSGSRCLLMKWGHCKEGYRNHVVLAIVVNSDGLPFYWEVLPGGTADATTITWLQQQIGERFKTNNTTLVFDRGMVSDKNLSLLEDEGIRYISAMDKNQIEEIAKLDFNQFSYFDPKKIDEQAEILDGFTKIRSDTYCREIALEGDRRYILCFNPQLFKDQRKAREQAITEFRILVDSLNAELMEARKSRQREATQKKFKKAAAKYKLSKFVDILLEPVSVPIKSGDAKITTYQGTVIIGKEKKIASGKLDGFWLLVTNQSEKDIDDFKVSIGEAVKPYRDKVIIESAFRDIKSFAEVSPVFVWTQQHVKAHYTICVLSYLINRTLALRLQEQSGTLTSEVVSHEKLYAKLSGCMIDQIKVENAGLTTYNTSTPSDEHKELLSRIKLKNLLQRDIIKKIRSRIVSD